MTRKDIYINVALKLLQNRPLGAIRDSDKGLYICGDFLADVRLLSEEILKGSEQFDQEQQVKTREKLLKE